MYATVAGAVLYQASVGPASLAAFVKTNEHQFMSPAMEAAVRRASYICKKNIIKTSKDAHTHIHAHSDA